MQVVNSARQLFHRGCIGLGGAVDLLDGPAQFADIFGLLPAGGADGFHHSEKYIHTAHEIFQRFRSHFHHLIAVLDASHRVSNEGIDLSCSYGCPLRQGSHLFGHHGKSLAVLSCPGGLHRGVEGKKVRMEGDFIYGQDDVSYLFRVLSREEKEFFVWSMSMVTALDDSCPSCMRLAL